MSWARGAQDDLGREIGYAIKAKCDFEGCEIEIDRGLGYVCGTMHNSENEDGCGRYFCPEHLHKHPCQLRDIDFLKSVGEYEDHNDMDENGQVDLYDHELSMLQDVNEERDGAPPEPPKDENDD